MLSRYCRDGKRRQAWGWGTADRRDFFKAKGDARDAEVAGSSKSAMANGPGGHD